MRPPERPDTGPHMTTADPSARGPENYISGWQRGLAWLGAAWSIASVLYFTYWLLIQHPKTLELLLHLVGLDP